MLATNVAETAVTIDGVVCVINSGRAKEKRFDPYSGVSTLQTTWISKANERQRRGRAGRTRAGVAFHMYSRQRAESFQVLSSFIHAILSLHQHCSIHRDFLLSPMNNEWLIY